MTLTATHHPKKKNKDTPTIQKARPSCIPVSKDKSVYQLSRTVILTNQKIYKCQTVLQHQVNKSPDNSHPYLHRRQLQSPHIPSKQENLFYQHHLHQPEKQLLQDHHCTTTCYTTTKNAFQDHLEQPNYNQQPPLLPNPSYHHIMPGNQIPTLTRPHPHAQGQLIPQVSLYLPVFVTLSKPIHQPTPVYICSIRIKK